MDTRGRDRGIMLRAAALALLALRPLPALAQDGAADEDSRRCLALAVAYEAGHEPLAGQQAVAEVVLNRVAHPAFPKTICGVVFQGSRRSTGCQFTFTCDGALRRRLAASTLMAARAVADGVLDGAVPRRVPGALNYHADYVHPGWADTLGRVTKLGAHIFYRPLTGSGPVGGAMRDWSGEEPDPAILARVFGGAADAPRAAAAVPVPPVRAPADGFAPWGLSLRR
ncbi:MAG: hypothetical protein RIS94_3424 [Pseudomonadota bacterium]|jgi:hypothetical protein